jgi:hypothetical protein
VVAAVRFLVTVLFLSGGGALRISVVRRLSSPSSAASGFVEFFVPHPDRGRPIWLLMLLLVEMVMGFAKVTTALGAGPQGPLSGDFSAARGRLPIQACSGLRFTEGPVCNFCFAVDPLCNLEALISSFFPAKKNICLLLCRI